MSFDRDAGLSHDTLQVTHHIAPDLGSEREGLMDGLLDASLFERMFTIDGVGPARAVATAAATAT